MAKNTFHNLAGFIIGFITLLIGVYSLFTPTLSLLLVTILVSSAVLIQGIVQIVLYFSYKRHLPNSGFTLFSAILNIVFGIFLLPNLDLTAISLCLLVGIWFMFSSIMRVAHSFVLKDAKFENWWISLIFGIISTAFSIWLMWNPLNGAAVISTTVSISLICTAFLLVGEAFSSN